MCLVSDLFALSQSPQCWSYRECPQMLCFLCKAAWAPLVMAAFNKYGLSRRVRMIQDGYITGSELRRSACSGRISESAFKAPHSSSG